MFRRWLKEILALCKRINVPSSQQALLLLYRPHSYVSPYYLWSSTANTIPISLLDNNYNMAFKAVPLHGHQILLAVRGEKGRTKCCYRVNVIQTQSRALGSCGQNVMGFSRYRLILKGWVSSNATGSTPWRVHTAHIA